MWIGSESCSQPTWPLSVAFVEESPRWFFISANTSCLSRPDEYLWWYCQECGARSLSKQMYNCKNFRTPSKMTGCSSLGSPSTVSSTSLTASQSTAQKASNVRTKSWNHLFQRLLARIPLHIFLQQFWIRLQQPWHFSVLGIFSCNKKISACFQLLSNCLWSLSHRQRSQISDQPLTFSFPLSSWCQLDIQTFAEIGIESWKIWTFSNHQRVRTYVMVTEAK